MGVGGGGGGVHVIQYGRQEHISWQMHLFFYNVELIFITLEMVLSLQYDISLNECISCCRERPSNVVITCIQSLCLNCNKI